MRYSSAKVQHLRTDKSILLVIVSMGLSKCANYRLLFPLLTFIRYGNTLIGATAVFDRMQQFQPKFIFLVEDDDCELCSNRFLVTRLTSVSVL